TGNYIDPETGNPIFLKLEIDRRLTHNEPGMVAMARGKDLNSASCQFYIVKSPMPGLNGKYAVFGKVVDGLDKVWELKQGAKIFRAGTLPPHQSNRPAEQQAEQPSAEQLPTTEPVQREPPPPPPGPAGNSGF